MTKAKITSLPPLYPEGRPCRRPTARRVLDLFDNVQRHTLTIAEQAPVELLARIIHGREEPDRQVPEWSPAGSQPSSVRIAPLATEMVNFNAVGVQVGIVKLAVNPPGE